MEYSAQNDSYGSTEKSNYSGSIESSYGKTTDSGPVCLRTCVLDRCSCGRN